MMRAVTAFGKNDLKNVGRDSLLLQVMLVPFLFVVPVRLLVPPIESYLQSSFGFDLAPYYPLILSFFFVLNIPLLFGALTGFLILDERDDDTLTALRVTPVSMTSYAGYRVLAAVTMSFLYILLTLPLTGLVSASLLPDLIPVALIAGLFSVFVGLFLAAFASNKVEGLAFMKGVGWLMIGPLAAYFVPGRWELLFGVLPTYWPARAFWVAGEGGNYWPYLLVGAAYALLLVVLLLAQFRKRLYR